MGKKTGDLTRTQLVGQLATMRGVAVSLVFALRPQGNRDLKSVLQKYIDDPEELKFLAMDLDDAMLALDATGVDVSDEDLIDGWLDNSWQDE